MHMGDSESEEITFQIDDASSLSEAETIEPTPKKPTLDNQETPSSLVTHRIHLPHQFETPTSTKDANTTFANAEVCIARTFCITFS
jgi:hypothetical protein